MDIIVCVKQVPDAKDVRLDPETNTLAREGVEAIMNPFDRHALEEAVSLKEQLGGKVTVLSMGPPQAEAVLREAISCGADAGVLVSDRAFAGADTWATSSRLLTVTRLRSDRAWLPVWIYPTSPVSRRPVRPPIPVFRLNE